MTFQSRVNPNCTFNHATALLSLVNTQERRDCCDARGHAQIVVEKVVVEEGGEQRYVRRFDVILSGRDSRYSTAAQECMGNLESTMGDIREFSEYSEKDYAKLDSVQWSVPVARADAMMQRIRQQKADLLTARAAYDTGNAHALDGFKFQTAGAHRLAILGGNGGLNCVTWAESQLEQAGAGSGKKLLDPIKASPAKHVKLPTRDINRGATVLVTVGAIALFIWRQLRKG